MRAGGTCIRADDCSTYGQAWGYKCTSVCDTVFGRKLLKGARWSWRQRSQKNVSRCQQWGAFEVPDRNFAPSLHDFHITRSRERSRKEVDLGTSDCAPIAPGTAPEGSPGSQYPAFNPSTTVTVLQSQASWCQHTSMPDGRHTARACIGLHRPLVVQIHSLSKAVPSLAVSCDASPCPACRSVHGPALSGMCCPDWAHKGIRQAHSHLPVVVCAVAYSPVPTCAASVLCIKQA